MSLEYTNLDQVKNEYVSINGVNDSLHKLVENDEHTLLAVNNRPGIWEAKWYNDDTIEGYKRGAAVWLNTETTEHLIDIKFDEIQHYILNSEYRGEYISISSDNAATKELFKNVCDGTNGYRRLYYLGNVANAAQVRVSLQDNNKKLPTTSSWSSSFRLSSEVKYKEILSNETLVSLDDNMNTHIQNYHLSSMTANEITSNYLLSDFSNVSQKQSLTTHNIWNRGEELVGFDKIVLFVEKTDNDGTRWFRLWSSGFLEHGGQLRVTGNLSLITVNLSWKYNSSDKSVVYDYQNGYDGVYASGEKLSVGNSEQQINQNNIGKQMTYNIVVTPANGSMKSTTMEIFNITNSSFSFSCEKKKCTRFSYTTAGFISLATMRSLGL